ncbi:MAG TPA: isochorismate synthase [Propionibacteriaceae bacterium]
MTWSDLTPPRLRVQTVEVGDPGDLLALMPRADSYAWLRDGEGMVGWGEAVRHKVGGMVEAQEWWADLVDHVETGGEILDGPSGSGLMAFGSFVFDPDNTAAQSQLIVPRVVVGRRRGRAWLTTVGPVDDDELPGRLVVEPPAPPLNVRFEGGSLTPAAWKASVAEALRRIARGDVDKVVLARDLLAVADEEIDPRWLAARLAETYRRCWTYVVDGLVGATPEMLVRLDCGLATSRVLAGTIRRSGDDVHDLSLAAALAQSSKDLEEHEYAVRSVAAALAPFCSGMNVPDAPYVLDLPNVLHLATDVTAVAAAGASSLALAAALHPSAAVCGTPTAEARELIAELEHLDRMKYSGPVGWIDARGDGEWAIALRCGQISAEDPSRIRIFAGCGIVAGSDPADELAESNAKFIPMRGSLNG